MILGIVTDDYYPKEGPRWGGTGWARIGKYIPYLPDDWEVHLAHQVWPTTPYGMAITNQEGRKVYPDVLWCQRVFMPNFHYEVMQARVNGQRVVTDIDDMLWGLHPDSFAAKHWSIDQIKEVIASMAVSDDVMASTVWLSNHLLNELHIQSKVVRNSVDMSAFRRVDQDTDDPVLGWAGAVATRSGDLELLTDVLPHVDMKIQHSGHIPGFDGFYDKTGVQPDIVKDMVHPQDYGSLLDFHIGLVPMNRVDFNKAKSDIKGIEYAAAGIPFIASPLPAYRQLHKEWGDVVRLASTPEQWIEHINELRDPEVRKRDAEKLWANAWRRDTVKVVREVIEVLVGAE